MFLPCKVFINAYVYYGLINVHEVLQHLHDNCHAYSVKELTIFYSQHSLRNVL